jgi:predicted DsbA family dithiol-disulfide isomerase
LRAEEDAVFADEKPRVLVTVFSDYICPFCYIADARLNRLRTDFDLRINWCFLEIHPDNPPAGRPVAELGYPDGVWRDMMAVLGQMADEEGLSIDAHDFTTNSRRALLLAEAAKEEGPTTFYSLHRRLFEAFFGAGANIGDPDVLRRIAAECDVQEAAVERAWHDPRYARRLQHNLLAARELDIHATPTIFFSRRRIEGAVPTGQLLSAARAAAGNPDQPVLH